MSFRSPNCKPWRHDDQLTLVLARPLKDIFLHCVLEVKSSNCSIPEYVPWCDPWNANQLTTDAPLEPRPVSRTQTSKPEVVTDLTQSAPGSWILVCSFPWLIVAITFTLPRPWNAAVNDTDWQPWLFCVKSDILTFPAWKEVAKEYRKKQQCWTGYAIVTAWSIEVNSSHQCHKHIPV